MSEVDEIVARLRRGELAYKSGSTAVYHGPTVFDTKVAETISQLQAEIARMREASENDQKMIALLRADLAKFSEGGTETYCEGCNAPLMHDEDISTVSDVQGCWGYVSDWKGPTPCYRYRTEKGVERSWPACAALGGINDQKGEQL